VNTVNNKKPDPRNPRQTTPKSGAVQPKFASGAGDRKLPVAPPIYRPQTVPKVLQKKTVNHSPPAKPLLPATSNRRPLSIATNQKIANMPGVIQGAFKPISKQLEDALIIESSARASEKGYGPPDPYGESLESDLLLAPKEKIQKRKDVEYPTASVIEVFGKNLKGWTKRSDELYTRGRDSLTIRTEAGGIYGVFNDGDRNYKQSFIEFHKVRSTMVQHDMRSFPERKGIASVLCYEGALYARSVGCDTISVSAINDNSAALAKLLDNKVNKPACCGWCFLTTACVEARGLPDDCKELTVLRGFRDGFLMQTEERRAMICRYYELAPAIVAGIHQSETAAQQWESIYRIITKCVRLIEQQKFNNALRLYKSMVEQLTQRIIKGEHMRKKR